MNSELEGDNDAFINKNVHLSGNDGRSDYTCACRNINRSANSPLRLYADYRQECQDYLDKGESIGLFGPIFIDLYDLAQEQEQKITTLETIISTFYEQENKKWKEAINSDD